MNRFFHFLMAAVVALTISFSFFSVVSSAEATVSDSSDVAYDYNNGILGEYSVIKFDFNENLDVAFLFQRYHHFIDDYACGAIFGINSVGKFSVITNCSFSARPNNDTSTVIVSGAPFYESWFENYSNAYFHFSSSVPNNEGTVIMEGIRTDFDGVSSSFAQKAVGGLSESDFINRYGNSYYLIYKSSTSLWNSSEYSSFYSSIGSYSLSDLSFGKLDASGKFLKLVDSSAESKLNICDWMRAGYQNPIVDFQINDNSHMDSYVLKVGSNSTKTDLMKQLYQEQQVKDGLSAALNFSGAALGINIPNGTDFVKKNVQLLMALTTCDTWDYDTVTTISSDLFSFSDPNVLSSIFSVNLSDYLSIVPYNIYRLDIVSKSSAKILATCYFTSERSYTRGNSGYGVKVYSYGSSSDADSDSSSGGYNDKKPTSTGNIADSTNVSDTVSNNFNNSLSNLDISSTFGSFESALNSVSSFFQACWGLFPPAIWAIILCGISLIIILRVLGR